MGFWDLRESLAALEEYGLLRRVKVGVDKNGELSQVVRWGYMGFPEEDRYTVLFEQVRGYRFPVVVGAIGGSFLTYAVGMGIDPRLARAEVMAQIKFRWNQALDNPVKPVLVEDAPCKENILRGADIDLHQLPVPVWTMEKDKGWDQGYGFITSGYAITRDPETGIQNLGDYRCMILPQRDELTVGYMYNRHAMRHQEQYLARGQRMPIALVIGTDPSIGMTSVTDIPYGVDELDVAGGLRGEPVPLVRCETSELLVPATAEIIIEGEVLPPWERDPVYEAPFGEFTGYQGSARLNPITKVTCITYRNDAIYQGFMTGMPPSESSCIRRMGQEALALRQLRTLGIEGILDVYQPEAGQSLLSIVKLRKLYPGHVERLAMALSASIISTKWIIVVDEDVDIYDWNDVMWNITFKTRITPLEKHISFLPGMPKNLDYSAAPSLADFMGNRDWPGNAVLIDATRPYQPYPATSLPPAKYLEQTREQWSRYGLPALKQPALPPVIAMEEEMIRRGVVRLPQIPD